MNPIYEFVFRISRPAPAKESIACTYSSYQSYVIVFRKLKHIMLANFLREYNMNRIFLSNLGLWPFQNKLTRNLLRTFCLLLEISYCPFEVFIDRKETDPDRDLAFKLFKFALKFLSCHVAHVYISHPQIFIIYFDKICLI